MLLDANVLYPATLRSLLIDLDLLGVYDARWTDGVQGEWTRNLLLNRPDLDVANLTRTRELMDRALEDACVTGYADLIPSLTLPDPNDRHVLAAAIHGQVDLILTRNIRDFPDSALSPYGLRAQEPDPFLLGLLETHPVELRQAVDIQCARYRNPPVKSAELLRMLAIQGVPLTARALGGPEG